MARCGRVAGMSDPVSPVKGEAAGPLLTASAAVRARKEERAKVAVARVEEGRAGVVFGALAEEGRWRVARLLGREGTLSLGEVMARAGLPKWTASRYLLELWRAGIVDRYSAKEDGRQRVYRLTEVGAGLVQAGALLEG